MKEIKNEISEVEEECQNSIEYIEGLKNDLSSADSGLYRSENDIRLHTEHVEACSQRLKNMHAQLEEFDSEKIKEKLSLIVTKRQAEEAHLELLKSQEYNLTLALDKADSDERNATEVLSQSKMNILSCEKDVQSANAVLSALRASLADNVRRTENLRFELLQIENLLTGISVNIEKSDEEIKKAEDALKEKKQALESLIADAQVIETDMTRKRENQKEMQKDKEVFFEEMTRLLQILKIAVTNTTTLLQSSLRNTPSPSLML